MPIGKVLIANRGEIALRIIRSCRELGIATVAVYSSVDKDALHVQLADEAVCVGEALSSKSYLNIPNILAAATSRGADAIHPGYGFLAENDKFAEMCRDHGLTFVGPSPHAIRSMGDKSTAKTTMQSVGVPTVPGSEGLLSSTNQAAALAEEMGYPVMIKATAGGGGRGMRLVPDASQLESLYKAAQGEAEAAFGNPGLYMEKFIDRPRHVEVQVLADRHGCDAELSAAAQNSEGDFAAVGDQHFADWHPRVQAEAGSYQRQPACRRGPIARYDFGDEARGAESTTRMWWNW